MDRAELQLALATSIVLALAAGALTMILVSSEPAVLAAASALAVAGAVAANFRLQLAQFHKRPQESSFVMMGVALAVLLMVGGFSLKTQTERAERVERVLRR